MGWDLELISWQEVWPVLCAILILRQFLLPRPLQTMLYWFKTALGMTVLCLACLVSIPLCLFTLRNPKGNRYVSFCLRRLTRPMGIDMEIRNSRLLTENNGRFIIVANHQSNLDALGVAFISGEVDFLMVVKKLVLYMGPIGWAGWLMGASFIDSYEDLVNGAARMNKYKTSAWIFPEGKMNKRGATLLPFKKGAFRLAVTLQMPIVPIVFSPYYFLDEEQHIFDSGKIILKVLPPISTEGLSMRDVDSLTERTRDAMLETYNALYKELVAPNLNIKYDKLAAN